LARDDHAAAAAAAAASPSLTTCNYQRRDCMHRRTTRSPSQTTSRLMLLTRTTSFIVMVPASRGLMSKDQRPKTKDQRPTSTNCPEAVRRISKPLSYLDPSPVTCGFLAHLLRSSAGQTVASLLLVCRRYSGTNSW